MFEKKSNTNVHHRTVDVEKLLKTARNNASAAKNQPIVTEQMVLESPDAITGLCRHILHVRKVTPEDIYKGCMRHFGANAKHIAGNKYNNILRLLKDVNGNITTNSFFMIIENILGLKISNIGISTIDDTSDNNEYVLQLIDTTPNDKH